MYGIQFNHYYQYHWYWSQSLHRTSAGLVISFQFNFRWNQYNSKRHPWNTQLGKGARACFLDASAQLWLKTYPSENNALVRFHWRMHFSDTLPRTAFKNYARPMTKCKKQIWRNNKDQFVVNSFKNKISQNKWTFGQHLAFGGMNTWDGNGGLKSSNSLFHECLDSETGQCNRVKK